MFTKPPWVYLIARPFLLPLPGATGQHIPLPGATGQHLTVWPGHETDSLATFSADGETKLHQRHIDDGALYGIVMAMELDGFIVPLTPSDSLVYQLSA